MNKFINLKFLNYKHIDIIGIYLIFPHLYFFLDKVIYIILYIPEIIVSHCYAIRFDNIPVAQ